jgi:ribonuclease R
MNNERSGGHSQKKSQPHKKQHSGGTRTPSERHATNARSQAPREGSQTPRAPRDHNRHPAQHEVEGTIRISAKGVGYVAVEGMEEDIEIDPRDLNTALDQDRVMIILHGKRLGKRQGGEVTQILLRNKTRFVGVLIREGGAYFVAPDDQRMYRNILIPAHLIGGAKLGEKVFAEMTKWTDEREEPLGSILEVLGLPDDNDVEMNAIVLERGFASTFDEAVHSAAEMIPLTISEEEIAKRRDMRDTLTFTIDPKDAKDFDDALSWKKLESGEFEIGVHIADVSHYVTPDSVLDKEALRRATSIYLVDRTIPMLPERLSNGICSLVPNEDRLTFSAIFIMNERGQIRSEWFGRTVIHSDTRFSYEEAQEVLDKRSGPHLEALISLDTIAKVLREERIRNGAIAFEAEEVKFELDAKGKPIRVYKKVIQDTNKLIEEFMLLANKHVAALIAKDERAGGVFVYRVHDAPNEERMQDLRDFLHGIGFPLKLNKFGQVTSAMINAMLANVRGHASETMIQIATVRAMAKATYTTKNIGHYGLGFEYYTHFTSPIRRYPDVMVHRLLAHYLERKPTPTKKLEEQERLARYCSQMEIQAAEAERASIKFKQCEYFAERIGSVIEGRISGVTEWGIFVEDSVTKAEGMIHVRDIPNDYYFFEEKNYRLVGKTHGNIYRLGDNVKAVVATVDLKRKLIGMKLA